MRLFSMFTTVAMNGRLVLCNIVGRMRSASLGQRHRAVHTFYYRSPRQKVYISAGDVTSPEVPLANIRRDWLIFGRARHNQTEPRWSVADSCWRRETAASRLRKGRRPRPLGASPSLDGPTVDGWTAASDAGPAGRRRAQIRPNQSGQFEKTQRRGHTLCEPAEDRRPRRVVVALRTPPPSRRLRGYNRIDEDFRRIAPQNKRTL